MVPVIHALGQVVFSKLFAGFFCEPASEEASFWDDGHANRLVAECGVWSEHWQADLPLLQPLKQGSSNLSLEGQSAAEFSSNPDQTHLPVIF